MTVKIEDNLQLVHFVINKYHKNVLYNLNDRGLTYDDVYQMGCEGLMKASKRFDESLGFKFSTFAKVAISNEIKKFFRDHNTIIKFSRLAKTAALQVKDEKDVTVEMIMEKASCTRNIAEQALYYINNRKLKSLNEKVFSDSEELVLIDLIESNDEPDLDFNIMYNEFLSTLNDRRRLIAKLLTSGLSQKEISQIVGVSQAHVSREIKVIRIAIREFQGGELCIL